MDSPGRRPFWAALLLRLTTRHFRPDPRLPPDLLDTIAVLRVQGWRLRCAGPRHHAVWSGEPALQQRLKVVVVPDRWLRLGLRDWNALLRHRLLPLAPRLQPADPGDLARAGQAIEASLAPQWLSPGRPLGPPGVPAHPRGVPHTTRADA